jgi:hypothetical protein
MSKMYPQEMRSLHRPRFCFHRGFVRSFSSEVLGARAFILPSSCARRNERAGGETPRFAAFVADVRRDVSLARVLVGARRGRSR